MWHRSLQTIEKKHLKYLEHPYLIFMLLSLSVTRCHQQSPMLAGLSCVYKNLSAGVPNDRAKDQCRATEQHAHVGQVTLRRSVLPKIVQKLIKMSKNIFGACLQRGKSKSRRGGDFSRILEFLSGEVFPSRAPLLFWKTLLPYQLRWDGWMRLWTNRTSRMCSKRSNDWGSRWQGL